MDMKHRRTDHKTAGGCFTSQVFIGLMAHLCFVTNLAGWCSNEYAGTWN